MGWLMIAGCMSSFLMKMNDVKGAFIGVGEGDENQSLEVLFDNHSAIWFDGDRVRSVHAFAHEVHEATDCVHVEYESPLKVTFTTGCRQ